MKMRIGSVPRRNSDSGATVWIAYLVFFPVYLAAILLLVEASHMQAMKGANDISTHIASNAAARQVDYKALYDPVTGATSDRILLADTPDPSSPLAGVNIRQAGSLDAFVAGPMASTSESDIDAMDLLSAQQVAEVVYRFNANHNGLNSKSNRTETSADAPETLVMNEQPWSYFDSTLGQQKTAAWPGVVVLTRFNYVPLSMLTYLSGGEITNVEIGSRTVSQIVPSRKSAR